MALKFEKFAPVAKKSKQWLTVMTSANANTFKLPLMVTGKSANSRYFKNMDRKALPVSYKNQKSAWMSVSYSNLIF